MEKYTVNPDYFIDDLRQGENDAYSHLVDLYYKSLCIYACNLTRDVNTAEDIVQNVYMKIWKNRIKLSYEISLKSYLYKAVYNEFISQFRKSNTLSPIEKKHVEKLSEIIEEQDESTFLDLLTLVRKEIDNLPPKCKEIFLLSKRDGLTNSEIAEYLQVSIKSVEAHIRRGYDILQNKVGTQAKCVIFLLFGFPNKKLR